MSTVGIDGEVLKYVFVAFVTFCVTVPVAVGVGINWLLKRQATSEQAQDKLIERLYNSVDENTRVSRDFAESLGRLVEFTVGHEQKSNMRHDALIKTLEGVESLLQVLVKNGGHL